MVERTRKADRAAQANQTPQIEAEVKQPKKSAKAKAPVDEGRLPDAQDAKAAKYLEGGEVTPKAAGRGGPGGGGGGRGGVRPSGGGGGGGRGGVRPSGGGGGGGHGGTVHPSGGGGHGGTVHPSGGGWHPGEHGGHGGWSPIHHEEGHGWHGGYYGGYGHRYPGVFVRDPHWIPGPWFYRPRYAWFPFYRPAFYTYVAWPYGVPDTNLRIFEDRVRNFAWNNGSFGEAEMRSLKMEFDSMAPYERCCAEVFLRDYPELHAYFFGL